MWIAKTIVCSNIVRMPLLEKTRLAMFSRLTTAKCHFVLYFYFLATIKINFVEPDCYYTKCESCLANQFLCPIILMIVISRYNAVNFLFFYILISVLMIIPASNTEALSTFTRKFVISI